MTTQEAVQLWGGPTRLAKTLGITRDAVHKWKKYPPIDKQFQIMVLSGGRLAVTNDNTTKDKKND
jgi:3-methyladenine DNA glycosylase Mpg